MWIWNDFLLPYLVLDLNKYKTISIAIQYMKGSYGRVDMGAVMAALILAVIPVIIFYLACQKHIIKGVAAGAVKRVGVEHIMEKQQSVPDHIQNAGTV